jgi:hypothetical protein
MSRMTPTEEQALWESYLKETDPIEKVLIWKSMQEAGVDFLSHYYEECQFCGRDIVLRRMQQVSIFEKDMSARMQELRHGSLLFRCHDCREKKRVVAMQVNKHRRMMVQYMTKDGLVLDFTSYEMCLDLMEGFKKKAEQLNVTIDGRVLSVMDDQTDYQEPDTDENIKKRISHEHVTHFLADRKKESFLKHSGK